MFSSAALPQPDNPGLGRLVSTVRPAHEKSLIIYFNGYGNMAFKSPDLPHQTRFEALSRLTTYNAHVIWMVEERETWYLAHQHEMLAILLRYIVSNRIERIKVAGSSAGGYAALRIGLLLDRCLAAMNYQAVIVSFAVNPQTGFSDELLLKIRMAMREASWNPRALGRDPILLHPSLRTRFSNLNIDLAELAREAKPHNFAAVLFNDSTNPIEATFSAEITTWTHLAHLPKPMALGHGQGCVQIYKEHFWTSFDAVLPLPLAETPRRELQRLI